MENSWYGTFDYGGLGSNHSYMGSLWRLNGSVRAARVAGARMRLEIAMRTTIGGNVRYAMGRGRNQMKTKRSLYLLQQELDTLKEDMGAAMQAAAPSYVMQGYMTLRMGDVLIRFYNWARRYEEAGL